MHYVAAQWATPVTSRVACHKHYSYIEAYVIIRDVYFHARGSGQIPIMYITSAAPLIPMLV